MLFGGNSNAKNQPKYTGMQLQSSAYGIVVPVVYGTTRIGWNLLDYLDFKSFSTPSSSGGKGGIIGGGGKGGGSISYSASVMGLLCEGPISSIYSSWVSQTQQSGTPGFDLFEGNIAQTPWTYLSDNYPSHALTYSGFAYMAAENLNLGSSANLPNMNWEVLGFLNGTAPSTYGGNGCYTGGDADPSQVIPNILTNSQYGVGFPGARIGTVISNDESHVIGGSPYQITVTNASDFYYNINVLDNTDNQTLVCVAGTPGPGQYSFTSGGVYTFNAAQSGHTIHIRYVSVGALTQYQDFTLASGLWLSVSYTNQQQASSIIDDIMKATYSEIVWSSGVLQIVPRGAMSVSGNGYTYTPPGDPLFSLTDDDFMSNTNSSVGASNSDDPIQIVRTRTSDQLNDIKIEVLDRANQYAPAICEAIDMALVSKYGRRSSASSNNHLFADTRAGNVSVKLQLQDEYIRNHYSYQLDARFVMLDPMDIVELTDPDYPGLTNVPVRILSITENDDGTLTFNAEEYPGTIGTVPEFSVDVGQGLIQDFNVDPGDADTPAIFDVPVQLVQTLGLQTWLATHSINGNPYWGGCDVYLSTDNSTFVKKGSIVGASRMGVLLSDLPSNSGVNPDTTHTLSVNLTNSKGNLESGTHTDAQNGVTICFVDGEYLSYANANLITTYEYGLTYLYRGQWGSSDGAHLTGSLFVRLDDNVFRFPMDATNVGQTIYIKLVSFNIFGGGYQDISSVTSYAHTVGGPPTFYAPDNLTITPSLKSNLLTWENAPDIGIAGTEVWRSASSSFGAAVLIATVPNYGTTYTDIDVTSNVTYWYWIRHVNIAGGYSDFYPTTSGVGSSGTTLQAVTNDIQDAAITAPKIAPGTIPAIILAEGLNVVQVVNTIADADPAVSYVAYALDTAQLYRYNTGTSTWTTAVPTVDLTGQITLAQMAVGSVDYTKVIAGLNFVQVVATIGSANPSISNMAFNEADSQLYRWDGVSSWTVAVPAVNITGQITNTQISDNSISTPKLQANSVTSAIIAAATITGSNIAGNTITGGNIQGGTITGSLIAGGTITAANLAASSVTASQLAANAVTAGKLDVNAVTAGTIAVGAVNASAIIVNDIIVQGHLTLNSVTDTPSQTSGSGTFTSSPALIAQVTFTPTYDSVPIWVTMKADALNFSGSTLPSDVYSECYISNDGGSTILATTSVPGDMSGTGFQVAYQQYMVKAGVSQTFGLYGLYVDNGHGGSSTWTNATIEAAGNAR